jgi:hypothetical protein
MVRGLSVGDRRKDVSRITTSLAHRATSPRADTYSMVGPEAPPRRLGNCAFPGRGPQRI